MANYLYSGNCYAAPSSVYAAMAADCPSASSSGSAMWCTPNGNGYTVSSKNSLGQVSTVDAVPTLVNCVPEVADAAVLGGLVVAALAAAFALKILWRAF